MVLFLLLFSASIFKVLFLCVMVYAIGVLFIFFSKIGVLFWVANLQYLFKKRIVQLQLSLAGSGIFEL